jgi:hypothetical protein
VRTGRRFTNIAFETRIGAQSHRKHRIAPRCKIKGASQNVHSLAPSS